MAGEASDGQEVVRLVSHIRPDIAILDIGMPILNGIDAARELRKASPTTKTILLTRHDEDQYVTEALRSAYPVGKGKGPMNHLFHFDH